MKIKLNIIPDVPNKNGHIYPKKVLDKAIKEYLERRNPRLGTVSSFYPDASQLEVDLEAVAFEIKDIYEVENSDHPYEAEINLLDTPAGTLLKNNLENSEYLLGHIAMADIDENNVVADDLIITHYSAIKKEEGT